jgi:hypothetical protein
MALLQCIFKHLLHEDLDGIVVECLVHQYKRAFPANFCVCVCVCVSIT